MPREDLFSLVRRVRGPSSERRFRHQAVTLYKDVDFVGKSVVDIGGGTGLHSFYAVGHGASRAVVLEPEASGGHNEMIATFLSWKQALGASNVELIQQRVQDFDADGGAFDICLIQDAINHFDEPACVNLGKSPESRQAYERIFAKVASLVKPGGTLVVSECSSRNVFPLFGLRNPIDPMIEWEKHQPPAVWAAIAESVGFKLQSLRWSSPSSLGGVGRRLFGNSVAAWFYTSHFVMVFRRQDRESE